MGHEHHRYEQLLLTKEAGKGGVYTGYSVVPNTTRVLIGSKKRRTDIVKAIHSMDHTHQTYSRELLLRTAVLTLEHVSKIPWRACENTGSWAHPQSV